MVKDRLQRLSPVESLQLGMYAGVCSKLVNYPLLSWKNASQQRLPISLNPKVVYRGLPMACVNLGGSTAVQFLATSEFQKALTSNGRETLTQNKQVAAAFLGGLVSGIPCSVWELTMIQQQRFGGSILSVPRRLLSELGPRTLLRGLTMTSGRESLYTCAMLGLVPVVQSQFRERFASNPSLALGAGSLVSAFLAAILTHPMDTIKTCMQGDVHQTKYKGVMDTGRSLVAEFGVTKGLFLGIHWRICMITTTFFLVNGLKIKIADVLFPE